MNVFSQVQQDSWVISTIDESVDILNLLHSQAGQVPFDFLIDCCIACSFNQKRIWGRWMIYRTEPIYGFVRNDNLRPATGIISYLMADMIST